jgi:predicted AlkP superfamily phosphohydrolase/phosphomutase
MLACIDQRAKVGAYLLKNHPVDLFVLVFTLLDRAQHGFWADMDPDHPLHRDVRKQMIPDAILEVHKHIDAGLGQLLAELDSDTTVILMSDHGFRSEHRRVAVNKWLQDLGLLRTKRKTARLMTRIGVVIRRAGLQKPALRALRALIGTRRYESVYYRSVIWPETKVIYGPGQGFYVNKEGRDYQGVVTDREYEPLRDRIIDAMKAIREPETGLPIVGDVLRREEVYEGDSFELAPDVVVTKAEYFTDGKRWGYGLTKFLGLPQLFYNRKELSGTHSPEGMFIAWGPHISGGRMEGLRIVDVAPTAMYAMGLSVPVAMEGQVRTELFNPAHVAAHPVEFGDIDITLEGKSGRVLSEEHEALIEQRLKDLGYL